MIFRPIFLLLLLASAGHAEIDCLRLRALVDQIKASIAAKDSEETARLTLELAQFEGGSRLVTVRGFMANGSEPNWVGISLGYIDKQGKPVLEPAPDGFVMVRPLPPSGTQVRPGASDAYAIPSKRVEGFSRPELAPAPLPKLPPLPGIGTHLVVQEMEGEAKLETSFARAWGATHVGLVRKNNQDGFLLLAKAKSAKDNYLIAAVADGVGGGENGDLAAAKALETLQDFFSTHAAAKENIADLLETAYRTEIVKALKVPGLEDSGTTLTSAVLFDDGTLWIAHVGDTRAQILADGRAIPLTTDHSLVQETIIPDLISQGEPTSKAIGSPLTNRITSAFSGRKDPARIDIFQAPQSLEPGQELYVYSDGLHGIDPLRTDYMEDGGTLARLSKEGKGDKLPQCISPEGIRNAKGEGHDNVTVVRILRRTD